MKAVVLAGDKKDVERFKLFVLGKAVIEYPIDGLSPFHEVYLLTRGWMWRDVPVIFQKDEGIMGAIKNAVEELGLPLVFAYGDIVAEESFFSALDSDCAVVTVPFIPEERHNVIDEDSSFVFSGLFSVNEECYNELKKFNNIVEAIKFLVREGLMDIVRYDGTWYDIDKKEDVLKAFPELLRSKLGKKSIIGTNLPESVVIEGPVLIEEGSVVSPFVYIKGPSYIGKGAIVSPFTYIEASSIEPGAHIGSHASVIRSSIQPRSTVKSHSSVEDEVLG